MITTNLFIGSSCHLLSKPISLTNTGTPAATIDFDIGKPIVNSDPNLSTINLGATGMYSIMGGNSNSMFMGFANQHAVIVGAVHVCLFSISANPGSYVSYINSIGNYIVNSDENLKHNI